MNHSAIKAYQTVVGSAQTGRQADLACFRLLIEILSDAEKSDDSVVRRAALAKHQKLWSMIMRANAIDTGETPKEDRQLFVNLANQCQRYGIRAILDDKLSLQPLINVAENICEGLGAPSAESSHNNDDINLMF